MSSYTQYDPATGTIIGWQSSEDECPGSGFLLCVEDVPADSRTQYVDSGLLFNYTVAEIAAKDNLAPGWTWKMPERIAVDMRTLDECKLQALGRVKSARDDAEASTFTCNGGVFRTDLQRIPGAALLAMMASMSGAAFSEPWTLVDNTVCTLDAAGMIAVGVAQGAHIAGVFAIGRGLRDQIATATTNFQLDTIGWPE